jgi:hypothetical protein
MLKEAVPFAVIGLDRCQGFNAGSGCSRPAAFTATLPRWKWR